MGVMTTGATSIAIEMPRRTGAGTIRRAHSALLPLLLLSSP